ncbi:unnamed protein product, partial [Phaeothamnion confervicola]
MTPHHMWNGNCGNTNLLKIFFCPCDVLAEDSSKLASRTRQGHYLGPSEGAKAFRIYMPDTRRIIDSVHVAFNE